MFPTPSKEELFDILVEFDVDTAIIAGGVCRDIDLGAKESKDIDIFTTELPPEWPVNWEFLGNARDDWTSDEDEYGNLDAEFDVYNFTRDGVPVQVIHVHAQWGEPVTNIVAFIEDHFDLSSSMIWFNITGDIVFRQVYKVYKERGKIARYHNSERTIERAKRVLAKFPEVFKEIV